MAWFDEFNLPGATIDGYFGFIHADGPDDDEYPDVVLANGTVTFTATTEAARIDGAWLGIQPVTAQIFEGQIVISEEDPRPVRLLATDADIGVADWAWQATFNVPGFKLDPLTFKAPSDTTVNLTSGIVPIKSVPYQIVQGEQGASITDVTQVEPDAMRVVIEDPATGEQKSTTILLPEGPRGPEGPYGGTEVTDPQVASYIGGATATKAALDKGYRRGVSVLEFGAVGDGATDDTLAIQACADAVAAQGDTLFMPPLTYRTTSTLTIECDVSAVGATLAFTGAGTALRYGSLDHRTEDRTADLPAVKHTGKTGTGWGSVADTVGVDLCRINTCEVHVPHVAGFETGLLVSAPAGGNVHNTVRIGHLYNNKVNQRLSAGPTGWTNQNLFLGGKLSHLSSEGEVTPGTAQIKLDHTASLLNNNTWVNSSLEGNTAEWTIDLEGVENLFIQCRFEVDGGARVRWGASATGNVIFHGYGSNTLQQTFTPGAAVTNQVHSRSTASFAGARAFFENNGSPAAAADYVLAPGTVPTTDAAEAGYAVKRSANATHMKRSGDSFDRLVLDHLNGAVRMGNATAEPTVGVGVAGSALRLDTITRTTAPTAGGAAALPATPAGYMGVYVGGGLRYIPYY